MVGRRPTNTRQLLSPGRKTSFASPYCACRSHFVVFAQSYARKVAEAAGHATIVVACHIRDVTRGTADLVEHTTSVIGGRALLVMGRFEVVQQVELEMIDQRRVDLISVLGVRGWGRADLVL